MNLKSVNIVGITGGIGYSFFNMISKEQMNICGFYHRNDELASEIKKKRPETILIRTDLSRISPFEMVDIPNFEGLLYVAGRSHFGKSLFDFNENDLHAHVNLNVNSLITIIQKLCFRDDIELKKIVVVSSIYPPNIKSLYHATKRLQDEMLKIVLPSLIDKKISLSIIKASWIKTNMYKEYINSKGNPPQSILGPETVAKYCLEEFSHNKAFNLREVKP